jgi:hypothetical protein
MNKYIGIDLHSNNSVVVISDDLHLYNTYRCDPISVDIELTNHQIDCLKADRGDGQLSTRSP